MLPHGTLQHLRWLPKLKYFYHMTVRHCAHNPRSGKSRPSPGVTQLCCKNLKEKLKKKLKSRVSLWSRCLYRSDSGKQGISFFWRNVFLRFSRVRPSIASYLGLKKFEILNTLWSYNKMIIDWVYLSQRGRYLAFGHGARTSLCLVLTSWSQPKYFPSDPPTQSISTYFCMLELAVPVKKK